MKKRRGWFSQAYKYRTIMQRTRHVLNGIDHIQVSYEQLAAAPRETMVDTMTRIGLTFEEEQLGWAEAEHHHLAGNRLRRLRSDEIRVDDAWRSGLGPFQKLCISLVTRPKPIKS
jgi:hypothetical protein